MGVTFTVKQSETIHRELQRMAVANKLAKEHDLYTNDYRTWVDVNKQFYGDQVETNKAWGIQKKVLETMTETRKEVVLSSEVDLNTASLEHLECLPLNRTQIKSLIEYRTQRAIYRMSDVEKVPGVGKKTADRLIPYLKPLAHDREDPVDKLPGAGQTYTADRMPSMETPMPQNKILNLFNLVVDEGKEKPKPKGPYPTLVIPEHTYEIVHRVGQYPSDVLNITSSTMKVGDLWADSGCVRGVGGKDGHRANRKLLAEYGLKPIQVKCWEQFQFGNGDIVPSNTFIQPSSPEFSEEPWIRQKLTLHAHSL